MFQKKLKQLGAWLLSLSLVLGSAQLPAAQAEAAEGNLALNATATASSVEEGTQLVASRANDGEINRDATNLDQSRWASDTSVGAKWLQLSWDEAQTMKRFEIEWERKNPTDYEIQVSDDATTWESVWSSKELPEEYREVVTLDEAVTAKYVRLMINTYLDDCENYKGEPVKWNTVSVYELEVYADGSGAPVDPVEPEDPGKYTIYPTPQSVKYAGDDKTLTLPDEVNVVFEEGIDQPTKDRLEAVLDVKGIKAKAVDAAVDGQVNILIGVAGSEGAADAYANANLEYPEDLFAKRDAYVLAIEDNQITVLGKDTDAAFYGLASLKMILQQSEEKTVYQLQMNDYSIGQYRGFIEGYYGIPWSVDDRISLMTFGGDIKENVYIFAPKDDPYHNKQWRDLYPEDKLADITKMVAAGTASKCRFVWAIHPFMNQAITLENYDETIHFVTEKFEQLYNAGVRQFVISADDAYSDPQVQVKLLNDMSAWVKAKKDCYNLVFVPMVYCSGAGGWYGAATSLTQYYADMEAVDSAVEFMWTGEYVCHPATQYTFTHFKEISGREPFMWLNWPVNDVNHARLVMGPAENCILNKGGVTGFMGIVTNPLEQAEASKTSLFAIGDYAWNTAAFDCDKSWADCFQYIDEGAPEALHELCKHLTNPSPGGITQMSESKEIKPFVDAFRADFQAGNDLTESGPALIEQFEKIIAAADEFQEKGTNVNLLDEMKPWVDSLRYISQAGADYVRTAMTLQTENREGAVGTYMKAVNEEKASHNCAAPQLNDGTIMAESGAMVLIPFATAMGTALKEEVEEILNNNFGGSNAGGEGPSTEVSAIYDGLGGFYEGNASLIIDGKDDTYAWFNAAQKANAYVGVDLGDIYRINTVRIRQGKNDTHGDIFANAIVEYSEDGENYTEIETIENTNNIDKDYTDLAIKARYVRIRTASASDKWYAIREFTVTTSPATYKAYTNAESCSEVEMSVERDNASIVTGEEGLNVTLKAGEYLGIQLPRIREVTSITADYTANANLVLEGALDGTVWEEAKTGDQSTDLTYLRIRNKGDKDVTLSLKELSLTNSDADRRFLCTVECEEGHGPAFAADNSLTTSFLAKEGTGAGSLTWRIANPEKTGPLYVLTNPDTVSDAKVSVQTQDGSWVDKGALAAGLTIVQNLEWYDYVKAIKVEWTEKAPEIIEMYTVTPREMGIKLNKDSVKIAIEETLKLRADVFVGLDDNATVVWSSSDESVATVDETGLVTGIAKGTATITASVADGKYSAECEVAVSGRGTAKELEIKAVTAGSEETEGATDAEGPAGLAIDNDESTIWHSLWAGDSMENLWISADLGDVYDVAEMKYLPRRSGSSNGIITGYKLYVSVDGETWTLASKGTWAGDREEKSAEIIEAVPARYVKLQTVSAVSDQAANFASAAEINVFGHDRDETAVDKSYVIDAALSDELDENKYTEDSYQAYVAAKAKAAEVMNNMVATQEEVDAAVKEYREAVANLVIPATSISLTPAKVTLKVGTTAELKAVVKPADATHQEVTFTSDKPEVASVNAEGVVEAKGAGTAVITAANADGVSSTCTVTVVTKFDATGVKIKGAPTKALEIGDKVTVTAVVEPENADNKNVTWTSDKPAVATVDGGVVTAVGEGEAKITVTTEDGGYTADFTVRVNPLPKVDVTGVELVGAPTKALEIGDKVTVTAKVVPENADNKNVSWKSSKPAVATVANGVVTAVAAGESVITVTTEDGNFTASFTVKVNARTVTPPVDDKPPYGQVRNGLEEETKSGRYVVLNANKKTAYLEKAKSKKASVTVPTTITINGVKCKVVGVGDNAFKNFKTLKKITLNKNITSVGKSAFAGCKKLSSVVVKGSGLKKIGKSAFKGTAKKMTVKVTVKKFSAKKKAALLKKMKKAGMSKSAKIR